MSLEWQSINIEEYFSIGKIIYNFKQSTIF